MKKPASNTYDFDLTTIDSDGHKTPFQKLLDRHGLSEYKRLEYEESWGGDDGEKYTDEKVAMFWFNPDNGLIIQCKNNPISGKKANFPDRESEVGYASYTAICGPEEAAKSLAVDLVLTADHVKDGGRNAGFSSVDDAVKEYVKRQIMEELDSESSERTSHLDTDGEGGE